MVVKSDKDGNLPAPNLDAGRPLYGVIPLTGTVDVGPGPHPSNDPEPVGKPKGK